MDEKLKKASDLVGEGDFTSARQVILEFLGDNPYHAQAWYALIQLAQSDSERRHAIYHFWALDPHNPEAITLLEQVKAGKMPPIDEQIGLSSRNYYSSKAKKR